MTTAPKTFLLLDDNEDNRVLTSYTLRRAFPGARILQSDDLKRALDCARYVQVDAVVTDHHLGLQSGTEFVREMRSLGVRCPIVMLTASSDPAVYSRAYSAGADRVFAGGDLDFVGYFRDVLGAPAA